ncbi:hypothetical protein C5167_041559 [Papaver somniferum]|nr:hypothetical protein C5167_041559 [Papaver somniferum]
MACYYGCKTSFVWKIWWWWKKRTFFQFNEHNDFSSQSNFMYGLPNVVTAPPITTSPTPSHHTTMIIIISINPTPIIMANELSIFKENPTKYQTTEVSRLVSLIMF